MNCCFFCNLIAAFIALPLFLWRHRNDYRVHRAYIWELKYRGGPSCNLF